MKIEMKKRKAGLYIDWYIVHGLDARGRVCMFPIKHSEAKNYIQAVRFWNKTWGKTCTALKLVNSEPFDTKHASAC